MIEIVVAGFLKIFNRSKGVIIFLLNFLEPGSSAPGDLARSLDVGGFNHGMMTVCCHFVGSVPSPTTFRHVSGNKKRTARNTVPDAMVRNQKVAGQFHRISSKPLMRGATLAGVLRLQTLLAAEFHSTIEGENRSQN